MLDAICGHIHNYFTKAEDIHRGSFEIEGGTIVLPFLIEGQYFRIVGSALNDGVYRYPVDATDEAQALADETFTGEIWAMRPPRAFLKAAEEIAAWQEQYGAAMASPFSGENIIGVYSYTKATGGAGAGSSGAAWQSAFKSILNQWRKLQ